MSGYSLTLLPHQGIREHSHSENTWWDHAVVLLFYLLVTVPHCLQYLCKWMSDREPLPNPMTLAPLGTLATVLHACPSVRPLVTPAPIRAPCQTLLLKSCSISSHPASSLLASGCILSPFSGPISAPVTCLFTAWPFTISTREVPLIPDRVPLLASGH